MRQDVTYTKRRSETVLLQFDFLSQLRAGEGISAPVVTASVVVGSDLSPSSILSGSPTLSGTSVRQKITDGMAGVTYVIRYVVTGSSGATYVGTRILVVRADLSSFFPSDAPTLTGILPNGIVGAAYSGDLDIAGGYLPYFPEDGTGDVPTWMSFQVTGDELNCIGTPSADAHASYTFVARISDSAGSIATSNQSITLTRTTAAGDLPNQTFGSTPVFSYTASLGTAPYVFSLVGGSLPTGLTLNSSGSLSGSCNAGGSFSWTIRATDVNGIPDDLDDSASVTEPEWVYLSDPFGGSLGGSSTAPMIMAWGASNNLLASAPREAGDPNPGSRFYYSTNKGVSFTSTFVAATLSAVNTLMLYGNNIWLTMADRSTYTFNGTTHTYTAGAVSGSWGGGTWTCGVWTGQKFICCSSGVDGMWSSSTGIGATWTNIGANLPSGTSASTLLALEHIAGVGPNPSHGVAVGLRTLTQFVYTTNSGTSWTTVNYTPTVPGTRTYQCSSKTSTGRMVYVFHVNNGASSGLEFVYTDDYGATFSYTFILLSSMPANLLAGTMWSLVRSTNIWFIAAKEGGVGTQTIILRMNEAMTSVAAEPIINSPAPLATNPPSLVAATSLDGIYAAYGWRRGAPSVFIRRFS